MGLMDSITGSAAQNTGNIEKAIIEILDLRERGLVEKQAVMIVGGQGGGAPTYQNNADNSYTNLGVMSDSIKKMAGFGKDERPDDEKLKMIASNNWKRYQVKFNPNTLRLSGHSGGVVSQLDYGSEGEEGKGNQYGKGDTTIIMNVQLLFDACDPQDAFMGDKANNSVTSMATGVGKAVLTGLGKKKITVQTDVEGFIGAIRNEYTRIITFHWGELNYSGVLRSVRAVYTMFNITGDPVRATVDLSITCADNELSDASLAVWQQRYKDSFTNGSESFAYSNGTANSLIGKGKDALGGKFGKMMGF